jgi:hypothetical protein
MDCSEFRETMYLREDELTPGEIVMFERHRSGCGACAAEYRAAQSVTKAVSVLRRSTPRFDNPLLLTNTIAGKIEVLGKFSQNRRGAFDAVVEWLAVPEVRIVFASFLICIVTAFAIEYSFAYVQVQGLENSISRYTLLQTSSRDQASVEGNAANAVSDLTQFVAGQQSFLSVSGDLVIVNKSSIEKYILLFSELQSNAARLSPEFLAAHPRLSRLLTSKKEPARLDSLLKERDSLIRELNELIPRERKLP